MPIKKKQVFLLGNSREQLHASEASAGFQIRNRVALGGDAIDLGVLQGKKAALPQVTT